MIERYKQQFIFTHDYQIKQPIYSGGDFPSGTRITNFNKGDIVEGAYSSMGCQGTGCTPVEVVIINVNWQNWPVDKALLEPYGPPGELLVASESVGTNCYGTGCIQNSLEDKINIISKNQITKSVILLFFICFVIFLVRKLFKKSQK
jgi:hypothetical protein